MGFYYPFLYYFQLCLPNFKMIYSTHFESILAFNVPTKGTYNTWPCKSLHSHMLWHDNGNFKGVGSKLTTTDNEMDYIYGIHNLQ
jgi:hypothetical protein